eukprot:Awhi_evm1s14607
MQCQLYMYLGKVENALLIMADSNNYRTGDLNLIHVTYDPLFIESLLYYATFCYTIAETFLSNDFKVKTPSFEKSQQLHDRKPMGRRTKKHTNCTAAITLTHQNPKTSNKWVGGWYATKVENEHCGCSTEAKRPTKKKHLTDEEIEEMVRSISENQMSITAYLTKIREDKGVQLTRQDISNILDAVTRNSNNKGDITQVLEYLTEEKEQGYIALYNVFDKHENKLVHTRISVCHPNSTSVADYGMHSFQSVSVEVMEELLQKSFVEPRLESQSTLLEGIPLLDESYNDKTHLSQELLFLGHISSYEMARAKRTPEVMI